MTSVVEGTARAGASASARPLAIRSEFLGNQSGEIGMSLTSTANGLRVANVNSGSLAGAAGFRVGDAILAVNRNWVRSDADLISQLEASAAATGQAWVYVDRGGQRQWISLDFGGQARPRLGVSLVNARNGLQISAIDDGSAAAAAGLRVGDQVIAANGVAIRSAEDLTAQVQAAARGSGTLDLDIVRNGVRQSLQASLRQSGRARANVSQQASLTARRIVTDLDAISANASGQMRQRISAAAETAAQIQADLRQNTVRGTQMARERLAALQDRLADLKADLSDLAGQARGDVQARLDRTIDQINGLQDQLASIEGRGAVRARGEAGANAEVERNAERAGRARRDGNR